MSIKISNKADAMNRAYLVHDGRTDELCWQSGIFVASREVFFRYEYRDDYYGKSGLVHKCDGRVLSFDPMDESEAEEIIWEHFLEICPPELRLFDDVAEYLRDAITSVEELVECEEMSVSEAMELVVDFSAFRIPGSGFTKVLIHKYSGETEKAAEVRVIDFPHVDQYTVKFLGRFSGTLHFTDWKQAKRDIKRELSKHLKSDEKIIFRTW